MAKKLFTPSDPALPMNYPGFVFRTLREDGYPAELLLAGTGLEESLLRDPDFRSEFEPLRRLLLNAIESTGDPHIGVKLALKFQPTYIGLPSYAAMNAANFLDGLRVLEKYFHLNFPAFEFRLIETKADLGADEAAIRLRSKFPFGTIDYFAFGSAIVALNGLLKAMLRVERVATRAAMTVDRPQGWAALETEIGFPVRFNALDNSIVFPKTLATAPLPGADPINHARLLGICEDLATRMAFETTAVAQVTAALEDAPHPKIPLSEVASALGYSERGLRRQLERSGTSYRQIVDRVCERRARVLLADGTAPIKGIAATLGYESTSNFSRSFKRMTGLSPKAYRSQARAGHNAVRK